MLVSGVSIYLSIVFICRFGYADDLTIQPDQLVPPITLSQGTTVELTQTGMDFLTSLFGKHDLDQDQALSPQELVSMFSTCPNMPWGPEVYYQVPTNHKNWIGLPGVMNQFLRMQQSFSK